MTRVWRPGMCGRRSASRRPQLIEEQAKPKCQFMCKWLDCKRCRRLLKQKAVGAAERATGSNEIEVCVPLPLPKAREKRAWLIHSGSEINAVSTADMPEVSARNARSSSTKPVNPTTVNGRTGAASGWAQRAAFWPESSAPRGRKPAALALM